MERTQKRMLRAAQSIRSHLWRLSSRSIEVYLPDEQWSECRSLTRQIHLAGQRGWTNCQEPLRKRLEFCVMSCLDRLQRVTHDLSTSVPKPLPPTLRAIFEELCALPGEFDEFRLDLVRETVSVATDPTVLEDIDLGRFAIRLHWKRIGEHRCYDVVALNPNPASESNDVTHPHVRDETLCEGDGQEAIRRALLSGRLIDFFQIVTQILNTYNGGSAYCSLGEWQGTACGDCGRVVSEDDRSSCERCDRDLCLDCLESCAGCETRLCSSCTEQCQSCDARLCRSCRRSCDHCDCVHCANCLTENDLCGACQEQENDEAILEQIEESTLEVAATIAPPAGESSSTTESDALTV
jgi:hypothetical protein